MFFFFFFFYKCKINPCNWPKIQIDPYGIKIRQKYKINHCGWSNLEIVPCSQILLKEIDIFC